MEVIVKFGYRDGTSPMAPLSPLHLTRLGLSIPLFFVDIVLLHLQLYISLPYHDKFHSGCCCRFGRPLTAPLAAPQQQQTSAPGADFTRQQNMLKFKVPSICSGGYLHSCLWIRLNVFLMYPPWLWVRLPTNHQNSERG